MEWGKRCLERGKLWKSPNMAERIQKKTVIKTPVSVDGHFAKSCKTPPSHSENKRSKSVPSAYHSAPSFQ